MASPHEDLEDVLVEIAVAAAPPLTLDQIDRLRDLFAPTIRALQADAAPVSAQEPFHGASAA